MRTYTSIINWFFLLNLIFGEATTVARTIKQRRYENSQFLKGHRHQRHAAARSSSSSGTIAVASNVAVVAAATSPAVVLPTLLVEKVAANAHVTTSAQLGVGCFGICTALIIIGAVAAGGAGIASTAGLFDATGALAQLNAVVEANGEFQVGNCFDMRNLVFSLEMSQVAFNILFQDAQVSQFIPLDDQENIDGERLTEEYWTCENMEDGGAPVDESSTMPIEELIDGSSHTYTSLSSDEFYNMHPLKTVDDATWTDERLSAVSSCFDSFFNFVCIEWIPSCFRHFFSFLFLFCFYLMDPSCFCNVFSSSFSS